MRYGKFEFDAQNSNRARLRKMTLAAFFAALTVLLSPLSFPVGPSRCFPFQHAINAVTGVLLGPFWACAAAFVTSCVRNTLGTGTILAFPGSLFGALAVGLVAKFLPEKFRFLAALAEPLATGTLGAGVASLIASPAGGRFALFATLSAAFLISSGPGALLGGGVLYFLRRDKSNKKNLQDAATKAPVEKTHAELVSSKDALDSRNNLMSYDTVALDDEARALVILDQTKLPGNVVVLSLTKQEDIHKAIYLLQVRGAPAIGVAAAIGIYLAALEIDTEDYDRFYSRFRAAKDYLASARPTAVNLFWALNRMEKVVLENPDVPVAQLKIMLRHEAMNIKDEDARVCRSIGEYGLSLIKDGDTILTHCNAGQLATVKHGTALAPIHIGREKGWRFKVFVDETRPLLQGARLSSFELWADGVDTTVICDSAASQVMKNGWIDAVFVGCDRVAANGDACNKIGTSGLAILAKYYGVPFYVCAPTSTIDMSIERGRDIVIEERPSYEITEMWYKERMVPEGVRVYNPAFDVADNELITAIVTEYGIAYAPYGESLEKFFIEKQTKKQLEKQNVGK
jgi:methylthioribose-1-phosphate isomerase